MKNIIIIFFLCYSVTFTQTFKVIVNNFEDRTGKLEKKEGELEVNQTQSGIVGATGSQSGAIVGGVASDNTKLTGSTIESEKGPLGIQAADMYSAELVKIKKFKILDRNKFLRELGNSPDKDPLKVAEKLGAHYLLTGSVTQAGISESGGNVLGIGGKSTKGQVALNVNLVNVFTGEVVLAGVFEGEENKVGISLIGGGTTAKADLGLLLSAALKNAVKNSIPQIDSAAGDVFNFPIECELAVSDGIIYLSKGSDDGVRVGDEFEVIGIGKKIKVGSKTIEEKVNKGLIKVTSVEPEYSVANKLSDFTISSNDYARRVKK